MDVNERDDLAVSVALKIAELDRLDWVAMAEADGDYEFADFVRRLGWGRKSYRFDAPKPNQMLSSNFVRSRLVSPPAKVVESKEDKRP